MWLLSGCRATITLLSKLQTVDFAALYSTRYLCRSTQGDLLGASLEFSDIQAKIQHPSRAIWDGCQRETGTKTSCFYHPYNAATKWEHRTALNTALPISHALVVVSAKYAAGVSALNVVIVSGRTASPVSIRIPLEG
jgi:hypothetical protein